MADKLLGKLEPVALKHMWSDEAGDFTPWLAREESLAGLSEALGMELELEGIEVQVGPYRADIVARDASSDMKVIIENQLDKTDHDHLGKLLTYASALDAKGVIWIAREFSEEHRRAIDYLNEMAAPNLNCFGIEMQLWRIGSSPPAPLFRVVARPNEFTSSIKSEGGELTETQALYLEFWTGFRDYSKSHRTFLSIRKPRPQHWFYIAVGRSKFALSLTASMQKHRIGCEIYLRGANAKKAFKLLENDRTAIEQQTGPLDWQELPEAQACRIAIFRSDTDLSDKTKWNEAYAWLKEEAEIFHKAFAPRIKALPLLDTNDSEETLSSTGDN